MTEEQELINKAKHGDKIALNALITKQWQPIYQFVLLKVGHVHDAQEIVQETFLRAFRALPRYQEKNASFKTYLSRIALNLITDYWRKSGRAPRTVDILDYQGPLEDKRGKPEEQALRAEQRHAMEQMLALLSAEQRQVIKLRIIEGTSVAETAAIMEKTEAAVKMLQQRALANLRKLMQEQGIER